MNRLRIALVTFGAVGILAGGGAAIANAASSSSGTTTNSGSTTTPSTGSTTTPSQSNTPKLPEHVGRTAHADRHRTFTERRRRKPASRSHPPLSVRWFAPTVFYLRYLRSELLRRRGRTIVTLLGLGLGVALVIAIASLSTGLDRAQKKTLDPLGGIGTDLTVTLPPQQNQTAGFGGRGGGRDLIAANQSVLTDLSKLGKPGTHFVHDFFLPGSQLTFQQTAAKQVAALANVAQVTSGLTLLAEHQEGVVPKIVAKLKTGGQTFRIQRNIPRPTAAQFAAMQACFAKLGVRARRQRNGGGGRAGGGFGGGGGGADRGAFAQVPACRPAPVPHAASRRRSRR